MRAPLHVRPSQPLSWGLFLAALVLTACSAGERARGPAEATGVSRMVFSSERAGNPEIYVSNADGSDAVRLTLHPAEDVDPDVSPGRGRVVFASNRGGSYDIYVMALNGGDAVNLTNSSGEDGWPRWSPDGTRIAFHSDRDGQGEIYIMNADGSSATRVSNHPGPDLFPEWFPDGTRLLFRRDHDVWSAGVDGADPRQLTDHPGLDQMAVATSDGQKVVFGSLRDGHCAIYVMNADGSDPLKLIPTRDVEFPKQECWGWPAWGRDGRIYFSASTVETGGEREIYVMGIDGSGVMRLTHAPGHDTAPRPF